MSTSLNELLIRTRQGDRDAIPIFFRRCRAVALDQIRATLRRKHRLEGLLREREESDDLVQGVISALIADGSSLQLRTEISVEAILRRRVKNYLIDRARYYRAQRRETRRELLVHFDWSHFRFSTHWEDPAAVVAKSEQRRLVSIALEFLPSRDRAVVLLRRCYGFSHADVADCLGLVSPEAARRRNSQALNLLGSITRKLQRRGEVALVSLLDGEKRRDFLRNGRSQRGRGFQRREAGDSEQREGPSNGKR